jgi:hypothetical protein
MAEFVRDYVKKHLAGIGLAPWLRRSEINLYRQPNNTAPIGINVCVPHLAVRGFGKSNQDVGA